MNKQTRKFIWNFFWMIIGLILVSDYWEQALNADSYFTSDMLILIIGLLVMVDGFRKADSTTE